MSRLNGTPGPDPGFGGKLSEEAHKVIVESIASGIPRKYAAMRAGVDYSTLWRWLKNGKNSKNKDGLEYKLYEAVKRAEGECVAHCVSLVHTAAIDSWQAAAWWLERRCPEEFGRDTEVIQALKKLMREKILGGT